MYEDYEEFDDYEPDYDEPMCPGNGTCLGEKCPYLNGNQCTL